MTEAELFVASIPQNLEVGITNETLDPTGTHKVGEWTPSEFNVDGNTIHVTFNDGTKARLDVSLGEGPKDYRLFCGKLSVVMGKMFIALQQINNVASLATAATTNATVHAELSAVKTTVDAVLKESLAVLQEFEFTTKR